MCTCGRDYTWEQPLWKTVWRLLKKLRIKLPHDPAIPLLGVYLKEVKHELKNACVLSGSLQLSLQHPRYGSIVY